MNWSWRGFKDSRMAGTFIGDEVLSKKTEQKHLRYEEERKKKLQASKQQPLELVTKSHLRFTKREGRGDNMTITQCPITVGIYQHVAPGEL